MGAAAFFLALRAADALFVATHFSPDEFWQGPEVAHRLVFGRGHLTWEWAPEAALRSYVHPLLFAPALWAARVLALDSPGVVAALPRLVQAALTAWGDVAVWRLARRLYGPAGGRAAALLYVGGWFSLYAGTRTFSSCAETAFTARGLLDWDRRPWRALTWAALACAVRPTAAVTWAVLLLLRRAYWARAAVVAAAALGLQVALDSLMYGRWPTVTAWNFVRVNVGSGVAALYGTHPWHWYATQGLPAVAGLALPLAALQAWRSRGARPELELWAPAAALVAALSLSPHKEFRFVLPVLPALSVLGGGFAAGCGRLRRWWGPWLALNVAVAVYMGRWHQRAPVAAVEFLARDVRPGDEVHFLTPCHAAPLYAVLHADVAVRTLDCSPPGPWAALGVSDAGFREDPAGFTADLYRRAWPAPSHAVAFSSAGLAPVLRGLGMERRAAFFHAHVAGDGHEGELEVWGTPLG